jgi:very-short-patch-repair endonuclease
MSLYEIAQEYGTYANKVRRDANKLGANFRSKSEAQKNALATGAQTHPTKGKVRSEEVKIKISESVAGVWENMDDKEKTRRSKLAKMQWKDMSVEEKKDLRNKAYAGVREASKNGSKLEKSILEWLVDKGYKTIFHKDHIIGNDRMHLDIVVKDLAVVIEIDGPSHFEPIWGEDKLKKSKATDNKKDGILLNSGFSIIRVLQKKAITKKLVRDILVQLEVTLARIEKKKNRKLGIRKFTIGE